MVDDLMKSLLNNDIKLEDEGDLSKFLGVGLVMELDGIINLR